MSDRNQDFRLNMKSIFKAIFSRMKQEFEANADANARKQVVIKRMRTLVEQVIPEAHRQMPLADTELPKEAKTIMREAAQEVFGIEFEPEVFDN